MNLSNKQAFIILAVCVVIGWVIVPGFMIF